MTIKGEPMAEDRLPLSIRRWPQEARQAWITAYNERFRVVATDPEKGPLCREELDGRVLQRLSPKARRVAGMLLRLPSAIRQEVLGTFEPDGRVRYPWPVDR